MRCRTQVRDSAGIDAGFGIEGALAVESALRAHRGQAAPSGDARPRARIPLAARKSRCHAHFLRRRARLTAPSRWIAGALLPHRGRCSPDRARAFACRFRAGIGTIMLLRRVVCAIRSCATTDETGGRSAMSGLLSLRRMRIAPTTGAVIALDTRRPRESATERANRAATPYPKFLPCPRKRASRRFSPD
jgi:hypothetical protein